MKVTKSGQKELVMAKSRLEKVKCVRPFSTCCWRGTITDRSALPVLNRMGSCPRSCREGELTVKVMRSSHWCVSLS